MVEVEEGPETQEEHTNSPNPSNPSNPAIASNPPNANLLALHNNPNPIHLLPKIQKNKRPTHINSRLIIPVTVQFSDGSETTMKALVDTGAEVSVIRRDLIDPKFLKPSQHPVRLGAANATQLCGGSNDVEVVLSFQATEVDQNRATNLRIPLVAYDAAIKHDIILSYSWLATYDGLVNPKRHGLLFKSEKLFDMFWVPGIPCPKTSDIISVSPFIDSTTPMDPANSDANSEIPIPYTNLSPPKKKGRKKVSMDLSNLPPLTSNEQSQVEIMDIEVLVDKLHHWGFHTLEERDDPLDMETNLAQEISECTDMELAEIAAHLLPELEVKCVGIDFIKGFVGSKDPLKSANADDLRTKILQDYKSTVFSGKTTGNPPIRGPLGQAEIIIKQGAIPVKQRAFP